MALGSGEGQAPSNPGPDISGKKADMARKSNPRSKVLKIRLTQSEFESFQQAASDVDLPMSDLARTMICGVKPETERRRRFVFHPVDPALVRQVAAIGNNLNQLCGWVNSKSETVPASAILARLIAVERALSDVVATQTHESPPDAG